MKLNELQLSDVKQFLRVDYDEDDTLISSFMEVATSYIKNYTGLTIEKCNEIEEFSRGALMIISDLYENRKAVENTATSTSINKIYDSMLNLYCVNLL